MIRDTGTIGNPDRRQDHRQDGSLKLWELRPVARPGDPHWSGYEFRGELVVRARTPAEARLVATKWYKENFTPGEDYAPHPFYRSAFSDEKLYQVGEITAAAAEGRDIIRDTGQL